MAGPRKWRGIPSLLLRAILEGMNDTAHADKAASDMTEHEYDVAVTMTLAANAPVDTADVSVAAVSQ